MTKALVVGYGSIGKRHARLLASMAEVAIVSSQTIPDYPTFATLDDALEKSMPDYVVIASITAAHAQALDVLKAQHFRGKVLVEKPLFNHADEANPPYPFALYVGYHLRFHPVIQELQKQLAGKTILSAHGYVGQHLSQWRPERKPKDTYSAHAAQGGGVLRDLSHELDMAAYLFGGITAWHGTAARVSNITADSEDVAGFVLMCGHCPIVTLQMNYLDHVPRREWVINTEKETITANLIRNTLTINNVIIPITYQPDDAYRALHEAILHHKAKHACQFDDALALAKLIDVVPIIGRKP